MINSYGIIYLIQPKEFIGKNVYKVGFSKQTDLKRCLSYGKGSKYISIHECKNPRIIERILIDEFNTKFEKYKGCEYFKGVFSEIYEIFNKLVIEYNSDENRDRDETKFIDNYADIENEIVEPMQFTTQKKHKNKYYCEFCSYGTKKRNNFERHIGSNKHKLKIRDEVDNEDIKNDNINNDKEIIKMLVEKCNKSEELLIEKCNKSEEIMKEQSKEIITVYEERIKDLKNNQIGPNYNMNNTTNNKDIKYIKYVKEVKEIIKELKGLGNKGYSEALDSLILRFNQLKNPYW